MSKVTIEDVQDYIQEKTVRWLELMNAKNFPFDTQLYSKQIGPVHLKVYEEILEFIENGGENNNG